MPELPEVETIRRQLQQELPGARIVEADAHPSPKFAPALDAVGGRVTSIGRLGKYLLCALDDGRELVAHLGMTGSFAFHDPAGFAPDPYVRAWWSLQYDDRTPRVLAFRDVRRFGRLAVVAAGAYEALPTLAHLGPDPFDPAFTVAHLHRALTARRARLKTQLLSQRPVAGVGNIYADEAFWSARVHPGARTITRPQTARLHAALVEVLAAGIDHGGTTLRDYRTVEGATGENQHHLQCYGRAGSPCLRCGRSLEREVLDGRSTTFCPRCQR